jgi:uncharacterized protein (DUF1501 family)
MLPMTRRDFLHSAGAVGLGLAGLTPFDTNRREDVNCILLFLVGGPSHLDAWDLKPAAPDDVRGPFRPIRTNVPGIHISEHFPRMAAMANQFALVRSVHHEAAAIHETGQQMLQTGFVSQPGQEHPHVGAVVSYLHGRRRHGSPAFVVLPGPIGNTGTGLAHGQTAAYLGREHDPVFFDSATIDSERYGSNDFGRSCLLARRLVEQGARMVTVNMFDTVFDEITWDCHAAGGALDASLEDYKKTLCPMFDQAYTALIDDLLQRGMLERTLVVATGEFGRTPRINPCGGRDHWPGCWTMLFAGGGVQGGQVIGSSDRIGAEPRDRPVSPAEVVATMYYALGVDLSIRLPGPDHRLLPLVDAKPISELFI